MELAISKQANNSCHGGNSLLLPPILPSHHDRGQGFHSGHHILKCDRSRGLLVELLEELLNGAVAGVHFIDEPLNLLRQHAMHLPGGCTDAGVDQGHVKVARGGVDCRGEPGRLHETHGFLHVAGKNGAGQAHASQGFGNTDQGLELPRSSSDPSPANKSNRISRAALVRFEAHHNTEA